MDEETRGLVESGLDYAIKNLDVERSVSWIDRWVDKEHPISSIQDLALGYVLGYLSRYAQDVVCDQIKWKETEERYEKIMGKKLQADPNQQVEAPRVIKLSKKDLAEIRGMLKRRIGEIIEAVNEAMNVQP